MRRNKIGLDVFKDVNNEISNIINLGGGIYKYVKGV